LQIYRSLPKYRLEGLKTWITRIAVHKAIDWRRRRARHLEEITIQQPARTSEVEEQVIERSKRSQLQEQLQQLPPNYKKVVTAYYIEDKSYEEIATETGLEKKGVETRLYRARNWMKRHWRREDFE